MSTSNKDNNSPPSSRKPTLLIQTRVDVAEELARKVAREFREKNKGDGRYSGITREEE